MGDKTRIMVAMNESFFNPHGAEFVPASFSSKAALEWTLDKIIRANISGFHISFINVQPPDEQGPSDNSHPSGAQIGRATKLFEWYLERCARSRISWDVIIRSGNPRTEICREANKMKPDLLVLGSRALERFGIKLDEPGVSEYVKKNARCPVILIKRTLELTPPPPYMACD